MADEKRQNPFEEMGRPGEGEAADHPPAYTAGPSTQPSRSPVQDAPSQSSHKPIAIPAITSSSDSPFIRAYPPILSNHQLPKESFLAFLDQVNKDIAASPPLQVLDATGGILKSVPVLFPLHWVGTAVSGLANLGSQGMSKSRADSSIKQANKDIFGPRGLKVEIGKLDALAHAAAGAWFAAGIGILQPWIAELEFEILPWSSKSKLTRFNASLKKYNEPKDQETRDRGKRSVVNNQEIRQEEDHFRKALWLVIREVENGSR
ncbi:unnamed protein product [Penicillium nalgiovense]|nr:unnamed protein product [Penicillium nalgiovense]